MQTFTEDQVLQLVLDAYARGRHDAAANDMRGTWAEHDEPRATREQWVQARLTDMARRDDPARPLYAGGPVDFETGQPLRAHLAAA